MFLYLEHNKVTDPAKQATKIKIVIGDKRMRRLFASGIYENQLKIPGNIWQLLEEQLDASVPLTFVSTP